MNWSPTLPEGGYPSTVQDFVTARRAFYPPVWTTSTRPTALEKVLFGFNTDTQTFEFWNGSSWAPISQGSSNPGTINMNPGSGNIVPAYWVGNAAPVADLTPQNTVLSEMVVQSQGSNPVNPECTASFGMWATAGQSLAPSNGGQKVAVYAGAVQSPGSGPVWSLNTLVTRNAAQGANNTAGGPGNIGSGTPGTPGAIPLDVVTIGYELDWNNFDQDLGVGSGFGVGMWINMLGSYPATAAIYLSNTNDSSRHNYGWHDGILFAGDHLIQDNTIFDGTNSIYSYQVTGTHSGGTFYANDTSPYAFLANGNHTSADFWGADNAPTVLLVSGTHTHVVDFSNATITGLSWNGPFSATTVTASNLPINVKSPAFGAKGDGTTDDTAAITGALTYAGTQGRGCVYLPAGRYKVSSNFLIPSFTAVVGDGSQATTIVVAAAGSTGGGVFYSANDALYASGTIGNPPPVSPSVQTDQAISLRGLGFDFSLAGNNISSFMFAKNIVIEDIFANDGKSYTAGGYGGAMRFIGCDNVFIRGLNVTNVVNAVDCWYGTTRVHINNASVESVGGNGGAFNLQGVGTTNQKNHSYDYHASNISIRLHGSGIGFFFDSQLYGSETSDIHLTNVMVDLLTGTGAQAIVGRGLGGRIHTENLTIRAEPGASYGTQPILVGAFYSYRSPETGTNLVATQSGSGTIQVTFPTGTDAGPGNYVSIAATGGGALVGNGLTLLGSYLITAVTGNVVTATVPSQTASSTGTIATNTTVVGYEGTFNDCSFVSTTFDGAMASGATLFALQGSRHLVDSVMVTENYGTGNTSPQYNSIIAWDGTLTSSENTTPAASTFININGAAGTGSLQVGYTGNNLVQWTSASPQPVLAGVVPNLLVEGVATSDNDLANGIQLATGYGFNAHNFGLNANFNSLGALRFYAGTTEAAYINATGYNGPVGAQAGSPGTFSTLTVAALINAVNDAAAATAGVLVGEFYRNGSQVMVRVT